MDPSQPRDLDAIRADIDALDAQLIALLNRRAELAMEVGTAKGRGGKPFFTPERERAIFESLAERNPGPLTSQQLRGIFREIVSAARAAEEPLRVAFWGPEGTFSHQAAMSTFGSSSDPSPLESISDVFRAVEQGNAQYGVVPIENSIAGIVPETLDMFPQTNVRICAETYIAVRHALLSHAEDFQAIARIYAGPQPFHQCRKWLREHVPHAEIVELAPTAAAARRAQDDRAGAAIGNELLGELLGLPVLARRIEDHPHNQTRFLVIGFNEPAPTGRDKTSLMFNLRNRPGELYRALGIFNAHGVNLSMIESRPAQRSAFEYLFYCDCAGHRVDEPVRRALDELKEVALETIWLGSYPTTDDKLVGTTEAK